MNRGLNLNCVVLSNNNDDDDDDDDDEDRNTKQMSIIKRVRQLLT
jgi:hypothetical protein